MKFGITGNLDKPGFREAVSGLIRKLERAGTEYCIDGRIAGLVDTVRPASLTSRLRDIEQLVTEVGILVAFGGDGTILNAARSVGSKGTPILGVNLGKLGFLAEFAPEEMDKAISDILAKRYIVEERLVLRASSPGIGEALFHAVNDVVLDKSRSSRVIDVEMHINGLFAVTYRGDGVIISTPTGSTAYALSNGGPIVIPTSNVIGITPISPHTLNGRPLVVPDTSLIRLIVREGSEEVLFSADGQREGLLMPPAEVFVQKAPYTLKLVKRIDRSYFDVLRAKLFWGQDARGIRE
jgi:NAD+ kinase